MTEKSILLKNFVKARMVTFRAAFSKSIFMYTCFQAKDGDYYGSYKNVTALEIKQRSYRIEGHDDGVGLIWTDVDTIEEARRLQKEYAEKIDPYSFEDWLKES